MALGTENVTWGWILWYSWLAAFNAQPVGCKEDVELSYRARTLGSHPIRRKVCVPSWSPSCHSPGSHTGCLFLPVTCFLPSSLCTQLYPPSTFEADIQRHPRQRGVDDIAQVNFLLLIEVELPAPTRGKTERDEFLSMEAIQWLYWRDREGHEK